MSTTLKSSALDTARHHVAEAEQYSAMSPYWDSRLAAAQAYATLALAETLDRIATANGATTPDLDDESQVDAITRAVREAMHLTPLMPGTRFVNGDNVRELARQFYAAGLRATA
jgi:hypothetical protein